MVTLIHYIRYQYDSKIRLISIGKLLIFNQLQKGDSQFNCMQLLCDYSNTCKLFSIIFLLLECVNLSTVPI